MCGIAGEVRTSGPRPPEIGERAIVPMLDAQQHRGPDAWGVWADDRCALGHRRLAIIDLSEAGRQPLSNEDGTVWITFNGEIYNFQCLRSELEALGHSFRTRTDTEVIVHAYEQWGTDCLKRLRGMFAFALWDQRARRLFLARDRVGKKPLFYYDQRPTTNDQRFLFASELQGLLADPDVPREVELASIDAYLTWGYVPAPSTGFRGIRKLPPAHYLTLDLTPEGPVVQVERYWRLSYTPKLEISLEDAAAGFRERLQEAVRLRMVSDVPLGAFLSGGIDSSIVVGLMAQVSDRPVKTFSIGFDEAAYNELDHARRIAEKWGTEHTPFVVKPDAMAVLPRLVRHYGEPYADSSALPTFYVSQWTRQHVTVALNGDGGDESAAGYERYLANRLAEQIRRVPGSRSASVLIGRVLPDSLHAKSRLRNLRRFLAVAHEPMARRYGQWLTFFPPEAKAELYTPALTEEIAAGSQGAPEAWMATLFAAAGDLDPVDAAMAVDLDSYLPYDLLVKVDITSMANSLEARSPFLDHEVMEFAARLPVSHKLHGQSAKHLLKHAFADLLPPENVYRRKMGFGVPVGDWFRGPLRDFVRDALLSERSLGRGYFTPGVVRRLVEDHLEARSDHSFQLWSLLMLELWHREVLEPGRGAVRDRSRAGTGSEAA
jgi:asparagine synthase (glutamine-hydrolysing)